MIKGIVAIDQRGGMGYKNSMPWGDKPLDGKHFKSLTEGHIVVMGRKTHKSMGSRPLPNRLNLVLTTSQHSPPQHDNVEWMHSVDEVLARVSQEPHRDVWIIGGRSIYDAFMPFIEEMYVTRVEAVFEADVFFPSLDQFHDWDCQILGHQSPSNSLPYPLTFLVFARKQGYSLV